jgi:CheY-like chemotaxis protein
VTASPRVLVVDDDAAILYMVRRFLGAKGLDVLTADSPFGVTTLFLRHQPHVVVLDVSMPGLDGDRLATMLEARDPHPGVVLYTAADETTLAAISARLPRVFVCPKTDGLDALHRAVMRALRASTMPPPG